MVNSFSCIEKPILFRTLDLEFPEKLQIPPSRSTILKIVNHILFYGLCVADLMHMVIGYSGLEINFFSEATNPKIAVARS